MAKRKKFDRAQDIQVSRVATWFAYYQAALTLPRYKRKIRMAGDLVWEGVTPDDKFEDWWEEFSILFGQGVVQEDLHNEVEELLTISIPLYLSETIIIESVRELVRARQAELAKKNGSTRRSKSPLSGGVPLAPYHFTPGTEFRCGPANDALLIYMRFFAHEPQRPKINEELLEKIRTFFKNHKSLDLPSRLERNKNGPEAAVRTLRRYVKKAEQLLQAAAIGKFPGGSSNRGG